MKAVSMTTLSMMALLMITGCRTTEGQPFRGYVLNAAEYRHYIDYFNRMEDEHIVQAISNEESWEWMNGQIPLFECPQDNFEEMYYFRWWTLRKHIIETPVGYAFTEFLVDRSYADQYNLIACAIGHHIMEARWLKDKQYLDDYLHVWYRGNGGGPMEKLHGFSSYTPFSLLEKYKVDGNREFLTDMLPDLDADYRWWEREKRLPSGLFWQADVMDGMEESISGGRHVRHVRPTINSYMYGNAYALSKIASMAGDPSLSVLYSLKADTLKQLVMGKLWNPESQFFETLREDGSFAGVREAIGYLPWLVYLPDSHAGYEAAWKQLMDPEGFMAPFGLTTAEQRHPEFRSHGCCNCEWDGAVWPFATSQTLTALQHLFRSESQEVIDRDDYFHHLERYVESQYYRGRPYIGEYLDENTGHWLKGDQERSRYYNHSTFNDLVITGLVGVVPRMDGIIEIDPLIPAEQWGWFCLDRLHYRGLILTIIWDRDGSRYDRGKGLQLLVNGMKVAGSEALERIVYEPFRTKK